MDENAGHHDPDQTPTTPSGGQSGSAQMFEIAPDQFERVPKKVGPYRILHRIGRGGMGTVYAGSREGDKSAARARVAIKLLRRGIDTEEVLKRFSVERQVLGALDHPNIARFVDAGETEDDRPYFVMEYVEGQPIDAFCDTNNLSIDQRLSLFRKVCSAVQHAHTNLVVHRDLKPANILVTPEGEPKLLDFGIAKLLNPNLAVTQIVTGPAVRLMTPEYASPEQVRGEVVTTLTDIYSLGVLLYELLTGFRPYRLPSRVEREIVRVICETDPERPSTALSRIRAAVEAQRDAPSLDEIARHRSARPDTLRRRLSGDIDDIIMHAMSKIPRERYASAEEMAEDIERHQRGQPVEARRVRRGAAYVLSKFVRRHRTAVAAASAAVITLVAVGSVAAAQWARAQQNARLEAEARLAAQESARQAEIGERFFGVLWTTLGENVNFSASPDERKILYQKILLRFDQIEDEYEEDDSSFIRDAKSRALTEMAGVLGGIRSESLGQTQAAIDALEEAMTLYGGADRDAQAMIEALDDPQQRLGAARTLRTLADVQREANRTADALARYETAMTLAESVPESSPHHAEARDQIESLSLALGQVYARFCRLDEASAHFEKTMRARTEALAENPDDLGARRAVTVGQTNKAEFLMLQRRFGEAETLMRDALSRRERILEARPEHPTLRRDVATARIILGRALSGQGGHDEAQTHFDDALQRLDALIADRPGDVRALRTKAFALEYAVDDLLRAGRAEEALRRAESGSDLVDVLVGVAPADAAIPEHRAAALHALGRARLATGDAARASDALRRAGEINSALLSKDPERAVFRRAAAAIAADHAEALLDAAGDDPEARAAARQEAAGLAARAVEIYDRMEREGRACGLDPERVAAARSLASELAP